MNYLKICFQVPASVDQELLIAQLSEFAFNGFEQQADHLTAYIDQSVYDNRLQTCIDALKARYQLSVQQSVIADQNWNAQWESDYEPVIVDQFCAVRASFHEPIGSVQYEIVVTPKMSFGTGHHATTYMMMQKMQSINFETVSVLDYGCGTGVLAILAKQLGARFLQAVDIDKWAYRNTLENLSINNAETVQTYCGTLEQVPFQKVDIVLANINRNVILDTMASISNRLDKGGLLLCSGFLQEDIVKINELAQMNQLHLEQRIQREKWRCLLFSKR